VATNARPIELDVFKAVVSGMPQKKERKKKKGKECSAIALHYNPMYS